jgi:ABC-type lipoprotein release transport system permease subunit
MDPAREGSYLDRLLPVLEGNPFRGLGPGEIMLSREYGRRLGVRAGDSITLTIHRARAGARMRDFRIAGMFKKSNPWQEFFLFAPLPDVQELLASQGRISAVRLILSRESDLFGVLRNLKDFFKENNLSWEVKTYREVAGFSLGIIQANRFSIILMDALLLFTTALGISLLILLSLNLRLHELRLLTWLGTPRGWLVFTVVQEALMLGAFFGMLGMVSGWAASLFFHHRGIPIHSVPISYLVGGDLLRPMIYLPGLIRLFFLVLGICFLSALVPMVNLLWRSKKLRQRYA